MHSASRVPSRALAATFRARRRASRTRRTHAHDPCAESRTPDTTAGTPSVNDPPSSHRCPRLSRARRRTPETTTTSLSRRGAHDGWHTPPPPPPPIRVRVPPTRTSPDRCARPPSTRLSGRRKISLYHVVQHVLAGIRHSRPQTAANPAGSVRPGIKRSFGKSVAPDDVARPFPGPAAPDVPSSLARTPAQPIGCAHIHDDLPHHRENADTLWWFVALAVWALALTFVAVRFRSHARLREAAEREAAVADFQAAVEMHSKETALDAIFFTATLPCGSPVAAKRCPDEEQTPGEGRDEGESDDDPDPNRTSTSRGWGIFRAFVVSPRCGGDPWTEALRRARREPDSATTRTLRMATMALTRSRWSRGRLTRTAFEREAARLGWRVEPLTGRILAAREGTMVRPYDHTRVRANV